MNQKNQITNNKSENPNRKTTKKFHEPKSNPEAMAKVGGGSGGEALATHGLD